MSSCPLVLPLRMPLLSLILPYSFIFFIFYVFLPLLLYTIKLRSIAYISHTNKVCYIPGLQNSVATTTVPVEHFFLPVAFGLGLLFLDEVRKYCVRRWPNGLLAKIAW